MTKKLTSLYLLGILLFGNAVLASDSQKPSQQDHKDYAHIKPFYMNWVKNNKMAGAVTLISKHGKILHFEAMGMQDKEAATPMQKDSLFRIYSMTKPIVSTALMMLWEDDKFKLDDPVSDYIPAFKDIKVFAGLDAEGSMKTVAANRPITIRDLMTHTAGMTYGFFSETPVDMAYRKAGILSYEDTNETFVNKLAKIPLLVQPGTRWIYSVSVDVQGRLIEVLSGKPLDTFLRERVFTPLGMKDTGFYAGPMQKDRLVQVYTINKEKALVPFTEWPLPSFTEDPAFKSGGGGLVSTTMDYWKFAQMMLNGGTLDGTRLLKPSTVALMTKDHLPEGIQTSNKAMRFGLGFAVLKGLPADGSMGNDGEYNWGGMANTVFWIDPKEKIVALFMTNMLPGQLYPFRAEFKKLVYQKKAVAPADK